MTVEERCKQEYKLIRQGTIILVLMEIVCIVLTYMLISFDTNKTNIEVLRKFIQNEFEFCYPEQDELVDIIDNKSIYKMLSTYSAIRFDMEIHQENKSIESMDDMLAMMKLLVPDGIHDADNYIKPWIYCHAIWDVRAMVDEDNENYYEIQYKGMQSLRLHEILLVGNIHGYIYKHVPMILTVLILAQIALFIIGLLMVCSYTIKYGEIVRGYKNGEIE